MDTLLFFNYYSWYSLMIVFLILEVLTGAGVFLSLGIASAIVGTVLVFFSLSWIGLLALIFVSLLVSYFIGTNIMKRLEKKKEKNEEPINN